MEEDFQILLEYKKEQAERKAQAERQPKDKTKQECQHCDQVEHEGFYVCTKCGLALGHVFQPEVNWTSRCVIPHTYSSTDRLQALDKHLRQFMEKTGIKMPLHPIQEKLRYMKIESGYKNLNYAIALSCILPQESLDKVAPFLPQSHVSWARSSRLLPKPLSTQFIRTWLHRLMKNGRRLTKSQEQRFRKNLDLLQPEQHEIMTSMIRCYGCHDWESLPQELRSALYRFSCAMVKLA